MSRLIGLGLGIGIMYALNHFDLPLWAWLLAVGGILGGLKLAQAQLRKNRS